MINCIKRYLILLLYFFRHKNSYSQDGEDVALDAFFQDGKNYKGFFVDIGAHHPVRFSNTWRFYREGWKGINIDPTPGSMLPFKLVRGRDINIEVGIGSQQTQLTFFCFNEPALNTFDEALANKRNTGAPYRINKIVKIPVKPLGDILDEYLPLNQSIDFFTIDVEGLDLEVLKSNNWEKYKPKFILVEDTEFDLEKLDKSQIYNFLKRQGYSVVAALKRTIFYCYNGS